MIYLRLLFKQLIQIQLLYNHMTGQLNLVQTSNEYEVKSELFPLENVVLMAPHTVFEPKTFSPFIQNTYFSFLLPSSNYFNILFVLPIHSNHFFHSLKKIVSLR